MSYCPKCGNKVDETMAFCSRCGAALKTAQAGPPAPVPSYRRNEKSEKNEKREKNEHPEKGEKSEKGEQGFIGFLIGGLILITLGAFALLGLTNPGAWSNVNGALMLVIIGIIIIVGAVYVAMTARRRSPPPT